MNVDIYFDHAWEEELEKRIEQDGPWGNWPLFQSTVNMETRMMVPNFEGLLAPGFLPELNPLPHQLEAAKRVVEEMNGKAILADEVGLGKTIEAGLVLKEYLIRGLVKKVLILTPASLVSQWASELATKFYIPAVAQKKFYAWDQHDIVISSIDTAKRSPHKEKIYEQEYDLVIIDEAHKLKNHKTKNYQFVRHLKKKFCLLLTATPIQNRLDEMFHLVSLLKPGHLGNEGQFTERFKKGDRQVQNHHHLIKLMNKVMIRNRRQDTGVKWTERKVESVKVAFTEEERSLYQALESFVRSQPDEVRSSFSLLTLQREACSSKEAVFFTLKNMAQKLYGSQLEFPQSFQDVLTHIQAISRNSKAEKALELIQTINDKVIIFTEYRATQLYLQWFLKQNGISSVPFRGGFKRGKKDWMKQLFEKHAQVLIATEAGGEGLNLQFCHHVINFDLPWNPMRLEQRIGRVHRFGQTKDVRIYNFSIADTIEDRILQLLYEKIHLFEQAVGQLDAILERMDIPNMQEHLTDIFQHSRTEGELRVKMKNLEAVMELANEWQEEEDTSHEKRNSSIS
ncbi:DEAD/DEAH box helicase [Bacillus badius]|uniref:Superfamily II DNA/RNA helicase, SNF2 family n=1 Tax=Bacillus badius TaxID=1455 RepID=A0ABR5AYB2_BACBA|nr:SNF2-related protein [Bacillus badius]KIL75283.1 Superfamily II DNA/RNA helicase, SNF2 family [Bacillus badius]KIL79729.1 Superfamily II DNA/RNA helicase, SNF2 family [Bacillus badius]KZN98844.1 ATP-dependent helicase [Bacillus badius]KZR60364.1 ATP-dependent helicase [Bacillus badius]MED0664766.1 SNF2-related protein [Bacillus badius]